MDRTCAACGKKLPKGATSRRKFCDNGDVCKRRFHRGARANKADREKPPVEDGGIQSTEAATMIALSEAGKLGTPGGQAALVLARRIDRSHMDTGAGLASMVKRLQETIAAVTADAVPEGDPVDDLTRRREEKQRAAASG